MAIIELFDNQFELDFDVTDSVSLPDSLVLCLRERGRVDIRLIAGQTGKNPREVIDSLKGVIIRDPEKRGFDECSGYVLVNEYLTGNLAAKRRFIDLLPKSIKAEYAENIKLLESAMPRASSRQDIYVKLGSPWLTPELIDKFIISLFGESYSRHYFSYQSLHVIHDPITGSWEIPHKSRYGDSLLVKCGYGTAKTSALVILERMLNNSTVEPTKEISCPTSSSGSKTVVDTEELLLIREKEKKFNEKFLNWIDSDPAIKLRVENLYFEKLGAYHACRFNGDFLNFEGMSEKVKLRKHQRDAVARILLTPNVLICHQTGTGKTYLAVAACHELRRMNISRKNLIVVPNAILHQWKEAFEKIYPGSNVFTVEPKIFTPAKRQATLEKIRDEDFDAVIMPYSIFDRINLSDSCVKASLSQYKFKIESALRKSPAKASALKKRLNEVNRKLDALSAEEAKSGNICFDHLGFSTIFIDEAHNYRKISFDTKMRVLGIDKSGSAKCNSALEKAHYIQKTNNGRGVVLLTATPVCNSLSDLFSIQKFLQSGQLAMLDIASFDNWVGTFSERSLDLEVDVTASGYRLVTRLSRFHNLPELMSVFSTVADFYQTKQDNLPELVRKDVILPCTADLKNYLGRISELADEVRHGNLSRTDENMLSLTIKSILASLDIRLVDPTALPGESCKVAYCAKEILEFYRNSSSFNGTQLVFSDLSTPKKGFNVYDALRNKLIESGIPGEEIAFIHDATTEKAKSRLLEATREGRIRVLIGSTDKLGTGVNVQHRVVAIHHLSIPWTPNSLVQREGRAIRQLNMNRKVTVCTYITRNSADAFSYQLLQTKQKFIDQVFSGCVTDRDGIEVGETAFTYGQLKAIAIGNPLLKERFEAANELSKFRALRRKNIDIKDKLEAQRSEMPGLIEKQLDLIWHCNKDKEYVEGNEQPVNDTERRKQLRKSVAEKMNMDDASHDLIISNHYHGFSIIRPAVVDKEKPYIFVQRSSRYRVDMTDVKDAAARIDNVIKGIPELLNKYQSNLRLFFNRVNDLTAEINSIKMFDEEIDFYTDLVRDYDKKILAG